jgi:hypothetical protein
MTTEFHKTAIGVRFLEKSVPEFIAELERLNDNLEQDQRERIRLENKGRLDPHFPIPFTTKPISGFRIQSDKPNIANKPKAEDHKFTEKEQRLIKSVEGSFWTAANEMAGEPRFADWTVLFAGMLSYLRGRIETYEFENVGEAIEVDQDGMKRLWDRANYLWQKHKEINEESKPKAESDQKEVDTCRMPKCPHCDVALVLADKYGFHRCPKCNSSFTSTKVSCGDCGWTGLACELDLSLERIPDLPVRLDPGGEVPAGTCPECNALAYLVRRDERTEEEREEEERIPIGTFVQTTCDAGSANWTRRARQARQWGVYGVVVQEHDSHGLCYDVWHGDGIPSGSYEPEELVVIKPEDLR